MELTTAELKTFLNEQFNALYERIGGKVERAFKNASEGQDALIFKSTLAVVDDEGSMDFIGFKKNTEPLFTCDNENCFTEDKLKLSIHNLILIDEWLDGGNFYLDYLD